MPLGVKKIKIVHVQFKWFIHGEFQLEEMVFVQISKIIKFKVSNIKILAYSIY